LKKIVVALFCAAVTMFANDGFGALGAGGIIIGKTNDIAMAKEVLDISYDKIKVDYEFVNESDKDITETIVFPLPPYRADTPEEPYAGMMPEFSVTVDGKPVKFATKVRAVQNGVDVTDKLKKIGFSDYEIATFPFNEKLLADHVLKIPKNKIELLHKNGLISKGGYLDWKNYVVYEWKQTFKAYSITKVSHSYRPFVSCGSDSGYSPDSDMDGGRVSLIKKFCADDNTLKKLDALYADEKNRDLVRQIRAYGVSYILKTANTWKDGIRDFKLIIRKANPNEIISLCFLGSFKKTSPTTYEVELKNFSPEQDLDVYFGNIKNGTGRPYDGVVPMFVK
jgi:hypothetical protein